MVYLFLLEMEQYKLYKKKLRAPFDLKSLNSTMLNIETF